MSLLVFPGLLEVERGLISHEGPTDPSSPCQKEENNCSALLPIVLPSFILSKIYVTQCQLRNLSMQQASSPQLLNGGP